MNSNLWWDICVKTRPPSNLFVIIKRVLNAVGTWVRIVCTAPLTLFMFAVDKLVSLRRSWSMHSRSGLLRRKFEVFKPRTTD